MQGLWRNFLSLLLPRRVRPHFPATSEGSKPASAGTQWLLDKPILKATRIFPAAELADLTAHQSVQFYRSIKHLTETAKSARVYSLFPLIPAMRGAPAVEIPGTRERRHSLHRHGSRAMLAPARAPRGGAYDLQNLGRNFLVRSLNYPCRNFVGSTGAS